jgi:diaminohydroxyphosphoribosylaminopyrimidine deaminase/5-amino-6-(5-phosphoribosylamino)uracil reductase
MHRCLQLAKKGIYTVAPNPMVGCVITVADPTMPYGERIIGEGYHRYFGGPHAEVEAIGAVPDPDMLVGAKVYVNLEPCSHHGKTPPCAHLLIDKNIGEVVVGMADPNPLVAGRGLAILREAGVKVVVNALQTEAQWLNRKFVVFHAKRRPYVLIKWAQSQDSYIGRRLGTAVGLSNPRSMQSVHRARSHHASIMVGKNTAINDNPTLNLRHWAGKHPLRILLDAQLESPLDLNMLCDGNKTLVVNEIRGDETTWPSYLKINPHELEDVLAALYDREVQSVMVEGGSELLQSFIDRNLWDEAWVYDTPHVLGHGVAAPKLVHQKLLGKYPIDGDTITQYINNISIES